jgi:hypothetical protein
MSPSKRKRFELEAAKVLSRVTGRLVKRDTEMNGTLVGPYGFHICVRVARRVTKELVDQWWEETMYKVEEHFSPEAHFSPVLMYRQHRGQWRCRWRGLYGHWVEGTPGAWWENDMHRHLLYWTS